LLDGMNKLIGLICALVLAACGGGSSPKAACKDGVAAVCMQVYACLTDAQRTLLGYPATEAACITEGETNTGCENITEDNACSSNETYHADKADTCVDQIVGLECADILDGYDQAMDTPACLEVCSVD
jgi:hypothetical protein